MIKKSKSPKNPDVIEIKELDPDMIAPTTKDMYNPDKGGSKLVCIGKPGTGKTNLITSLLYYKKHIFPVGEIMSGTEDSNSYFQKIFPSLFIYNKLDIEKLKDFIKRQKIDKQHLDIPWSVLVLDDCTDDPKI